MNYTNLIEIYELLIDRDFDELDGVLDAAHNKINRTKRINTR